MATVSECKGRKGTMRKEWSEHRLARCPNPMRAFVDGQDRSCMAVGRFSIFCLWERDDLRLFICLRDFAKSQVVDGKGTSNNPKDGVLFVGRIDCRPRVRSRVSLCAEVGSVFCLH